MGSSKSLKYHNWKLHDFNNTRKAIENKDTIMLANPSNSKIRTTENKHLTFQSRKPT